MFSQISAITGINLKSIPERWGPSLVIVVGLAGVVAVFTALFAMAQGFASTLADRGRDDMALILRGGSSDSELNSVLGRDVVTLITQVPGIRRGADGKPETASELVVISELPKKGEPPPAPGKRATGVNVTLRGVEASSFTLRPNLRIIEGRKFEPGLREVVVGRGVINAFAGAEVGNIVRMRGSDWTVVGVFESGDASESEVWADVGTAQTSFGRPAFSSVLAVLDGDGAMDKLKAALAADPRLASDVTTQREYLGAQTKQFRTMIETLGLFLVVVMGLGAIFAALNTMYAAVAARAREIATLRAIGFGSMPVLVSVLIEAMLLSLLGGIIGAAIAYVLFNNVSLSTLGANFTQVVFAFKVTPALVAKGVVIALLIGFVGSLVPAFQSAYSYVKTWAFVAVPLMVALAALMGVAAGNAPKAILTAMAVTALVTAVQALIWYLFARLFVRRGVGNTATFTKLLMTLPTLIFGFVLFGPLLVFAMLRLIWSGERGSLLRDPLLELTKAL